MSVPFAPILQESLPRRQFVTELGRDKNGRKHHMAGSGNGCGHDKENFRLPPRLPRKTKNDKNQHDFLLLLDERLRTELGNPNKFKDLRKTRGTKERAIRTERLEALIGTLIAGVPNLDIRTMCTVAKPPVDGDLRPVHRADLLEKIADTELSLSRFERAKSMLTHDASGYLTSKRRDFRKDDGSYAGVGCVVHYTEKLIAELRLTTKLRKVRKAKSEESTLNALGERQQKNGQRRGYRRAEQEKKEAAELQRREQLKAEGKNLDLAPERPEATTGKPMTAVALAQIAVMKMKTRGGASDTGETGPPDGDGGESEK